MPQEDKPNLDVGRAFEEALYGFVLLVARALRTVAQFMFRPDAITEFIGQYDPRAASNDLPGLSRPLTFVVVVSVGTMIHLYFQVLTFSIIFQQDGVNISDFNDFLIIEFIRSLDLVKLAMVVFPVVLYLCAYSLTARLITSMLGNSSDFLSHLHINSYFFGTFLTVLLCLASVGMFYNDDPVANVAQRLAQLVPPTIAIVLVASLLLSLVRYLQLYRWIICSLDLSRICAGPLTT